MENTDKKILNYTQCISSVMVLEIKETRGTSCFKYALIMILLRNVKTVSEFSSGLLFRILQRDKISFEEILIISNETLIRAL